MLVYTDSKVTQISALDEAKSQKNPKILSKTGTKQKSRGIKRKCRSRVVLLLVRARKLWARRQWFLMDNLRLSTDSGGRFATYWALGAPYRSSIATVVLFRIGGVKEFEVAVKEIFSEQDE